MILKVLLGAMAASLALPQEMKEKTVIVYLDNTSHAPLAVVGYAQTSAGRAFRSIGVRIDWRIGTPRPGDLHLALPIVMSITEDTPPDCHPGSFAFGRPYEGVHLRIFYDRLRWAESWSRLAPMLLAHVMTHEMTHLLEGISRHSRSGVMKANVTHDDLEAIEQRLLPFDTDDVRLIHAGIARRALH